VGGRTATDKDKHAKKRKKFVLALAPAFDFAFTHMELHGIAFPYTALPKGQVYAEKNVSHDDKDYALLLIPIRRLTYNCCTMESTLLKEI